MPILKKYPPAARRHTLLKDETLMVTTLASQTTFLSHGDSDRLASPLGRFLESLEESTLARVLRRAVREMNDLRVLDLPCGSGRLTRVLADEGLEVIAGDTSEHLLRAARSRMERYGDAVTFRRVDLESLDLPDGSFELVSCFRLGELPEDQRDAAFRELARVSSRFLLVRTTCASRCDCLRRTARRALGHQESRSTPTPQDIQSMAEQAGLRLRITSCPLPGISDHVILLLEKV